MAGYRTIYSKEFIVGEDEIKDKFEMLNTTKRGPLYDRSPEADAFIQYVNENDFGW